MRISVSELALYMKCPRAYKLKVLEKVPEKYKSLSLCKAITAKKVIAWLHDKGRDFTEVAPIDIENKCSKVWHKEISSHDVNAKELDAIVVQKRSATKTKAAQKALTKKERCLQEIKEWCLGYAAMDGEDTVLHNNVYFETLIGDVTFHGHIDMLTEHPDDGLWAFLFSTSSSAPHQEFLLRDFQASIIAYAIWQGTLYQESGEEITLGEIPKVYYFYLPYLERYKRKNGNHKKGDLKGDPYLLAPRNKEILLEAEYEILQVAAGIEMNYFPMNISKPVNCQTCPYAYKCNKFVSKNLEQTPKSMEV